MTPNIRSSVITATADDNIVDIIYKELEESGYHSPNFHLDWIGFEAKKGTEIKINGNSDYVPTCGYYITPYDGENEKMRIYKASFPAGCTDQIIKYIY